MTGNNHLICSQLCVGQGFKNDLLIHVGSSGVGGSTPMMLLQAHFRASYFSPGGWSLRTQDRSVRSLKD